MKFAGLTIMLLCVVGMWFALDSTSLAGNDTTLKALEAQVNSVRFGYAVGILFGLLTGAVMMHTFKTKRS
ncbi:hypothetical protein [Pseudomonas aeruginosa]|uniref:hypothetical protein n=1 Tax=Pseudomonas aeruginosa TaxID=287 RepID=UPI0039EBC550